jgi:hypothetical protein
MPNAKTKVTPDPVQHQQHRGKDRGQKRLDHSLSDISHITSTHEGALISAISVISTFNSALASTRSNMTCPSLALI